MTTAQAHRHAVLQYQGACVGWVEVCKLHGWLLKQAVCPILQCACPGAEYRVQGTMWDNTGLERGTTRVLLVVRHGETPPSDTSRLGH